MEKNIDEVLEKFKVATIQQGLFLEEGNSRKANREMDKIVKYYREIKVMDKLELMYPLLESDNKYIQLRVAGYLLQLEEFRPEAESVLESMVEELKKPGEYGYYAMTAKYALKNWRDGKLDCF